MSKLNEIRRKVQDRKIKLANHNPPPKTKDGMTVMERAYLRSEQLHARERLISIMVKSWYKRDTNINKGAPKEHKVILREDVNVNCEYSLMDDDVIELSNWLEKHARGKWYCPSKRVFEFAELDDAMRFKLAWG